MSPRARVYWPFLCAFAGLGLVVLWARARSARAAVTELFAPSVWLHRSALMDLRLMVVKSFARVVVFAPLAITAYAIAAWLATALTEWFGAAEPLALARWQIAGLYTVALFVASDASRFAVHMLLHRVPVLWELHKVHHSAEVLTPFTVYRVHPVESFVMGLRSAVVIGSVTAGFFYAFGDQAIQYQLLGVNALGFAFNALGANLRHSHVWLSYGPVLERLFISPAQHQLHHSAAPADYDCNYGSVLAVWDRLAGSLKLAGRRRELAFGLDDAAANHDPGSAISAVLGPLAACATRLAETGTNDQ